MAHAYPPGMTAPETKVKCTQCIAPPVQPDHPTLQMRPMQSEDGTKGWFINGPDFYCDIDKKPGESYEVFIRDKDGVEGFAVGKLALPVQPAPEMYVPDTMDFACVSLPDFRFDPTIESIADAAKRFTIPSLPVQPAERNFCERCGQRLGGANHVHTCTPPVAATYDSLINSVKPTP